MVQAITRNNKDNRIPRSTDIRTENENDSISDLESTSQSSDSSIE
ncbi:6238_t:CDS:1, partial [Acaulospora colombiana]